MNGIVLLSDPRIAAIDIHECGEPLVDMRTIEPLRVDPRQADPAGAYAHIRVGVVDRLVAAQSLLPRGVRLLVVEGYRPHALQERYFHEHSQQLRATHPDWTPAQVREQASRYISPPEVAPHVAGAAVDLTLTDHDGAELPMGTEVNADPESNNGAHHTDSPLVPAQSKTNRRILSTAMRAAGFVNYPTEWWHWSFGDRYWSFISGHRFARYGPLPT